MKVDYFTTTNNATAKKRVFCGRTDTIKTIIEGISAGKNIAVIGQRRIGKTFLRFLLKDILSGTVTDYIGEMIDTDLSDQLKGISQHSTDSVIVDICLHELRDGKFFYYYVASELFEQGVIAEPIPAEELTLLKFNNMLRRLVFPYLEEKKKRLVLVLDEFDVILEYQNILEILGHLKKLSEEQELFSFLFFGWNGIQQRIWNCYREGGESPFPECIDLKLYLPPLNQSESETLLKSLNTHFPPEKVPQEFVDNVFQYTGGRPYFIQSICENIIVANTTEWFDFNSDILFEALTGFIPTDSSRRGVIKSFFGGDSAQDNMLLTYIAHYPNTTIKEICNFLCDFHGHEVCDSIDYFKKTKMINVDKTGQLRLNGIMLEHWGQIRHENPTVTLNRAEINSTFSTRESFSHAEWVPPTNQDEFINLISKLVEEFQYYVKQKKGNKLLWFADKPAPEENAQILFDLISDQYTRLADINIDREVETGRGPVDFKFSKGHTFQAHLEIKRASSSKLEHGLEKQLPTYLQADKVQIGFYVIICYEESDVKKAEDFMKEAEELSRKLNIILKIYAIAAFRKICSASKV